MKQVVCLELPWPPSQNAIWRKNSRTKKGVYRDPKYVRWLEQSAWIAKIAKQQPIKGEFSATIILSPPDKRRIDIDNRVKVLLDLAQKVELIENDHLCRLLIVSYGEGEPGARLILSAMDSVQRETDATTAGILQSQHQYVD